MKSKSYEIAQEVNKEFDIEYIRRNWRREASRQKSFKTYLVNVLSGYYSESKYILSKVADIVIYGGEQKYKTRTRGQKQ